MNYSLIIKWQLWTWCELSIFDRDFQKNKLRIIIFGISESTLYQNFMVLE